MKLKEPSAADTAPKIVFLDTEIAKSLYAKFPPKHPEYDSYKNLIKDWWIICACWKFAGVDEIHTVSVLDDKKRFKKNPSDDFYIVQTLHTVLSQVDVLVGHNLGKFDWKKFYARVLFHGLKPIPKPLIIDTMLLAKGLGEFTSASLEYLTKYFNLPTKASNRGNDMWNDVVRLIFENNLTGAEAVIKEVLVYCGPDVIACEALYNYLIPHAPARQRVNLNLFKLGGCPHCSSPTLIKRGFAYTTTAKYQRYQCTTCGSYSQDKKSYLTTDKK